MRYLYADESNLEAASGTFFVYAGLVIPGDAAVQLSAEVEATRARYGYAPNDSFKFNVAERPAYITPEAHRLAKQEVISTAVTHGCVLNTTFTLHDVAISSTTARTYAINTLAHGFQSYLEEVSDHGMVFIDTYDDGTLTNVLREKFQVGFTGPVYPVARLDRILSFSQSCNGTSHFASITDIAVGALRYSVNGRNDENPRVRAVAGSLMQALAPMWHRDPTSGRVKRSSLRFCPRNVRVPAYREKYVDLKAFLAQNGVDAAQRV